MKVSLVVASGVHQGKAIPIVGPQFLIGRDPQCHLRPASQAVSKMHCAVHLRDGQVVLQDFGSTNGCLLNEAIVKAEERPLKNNDSLKVGPLDFTVRIEVPAVRSDGTPLPDRADAAALAAVKAAATALAPTKGTTRDATPGSKTPVPKPADGSKVVPASIPSAGARTPPAAPGHDEQDRLAAMLLGMDDEEVPGGSTVIDMPAVGLTGEPVKPDDAKKPVVKEDTSNMASDLLRRYMRRPK